MIIYKRLKKISAISFDLDDTLYDNFPVILRAEQAMVDYLAIRYPETQAMGQTSWAAVKTRVGRLTPSLLHDVSQWRIETIEAGLIEQGYSATIAKSAALACFEHFLDTRSQVDIPNYSHQLLTRLAKKYPIVAITNGNINLEQAGIADYFKHHFYAGKGLEMKPASDLFTAASQALNLPKEEILHIGDHLITDVVGAVSNGLQSIWLNLQPEQTAQHKLLPNIEIYRLQEIDDILCI